MEQTDILIAGGGIAGLSAAARLAADGWSVMVVDPAHADTGAGDDRRTTAFLQPAIATLTRAGVWDAMEQGAAPLRVMRIVDAGGQERVPRETADFLGEETGHDLFGWNVHNQAARIALLDHLGAMPDVRLVQGASVTAYTGRLDRAILRISDGTQVVSRLAIGADGRNSLLRRLAGIRHKRWDYDQSALVFTVAMDRPHDGVSTEIHRTGGPLTLVPMPDRDGRPMASIVWLSPRERAAELHAMDDTRLAEELSTETMGMHGPLEIAGPRALWPMMSQVALGLTAPRLALIAEAAHVMPPIGAQGLNTSLNDIETLSGLIAGQQDPGAPGPLARYEARQLPMIMAKVAGIDLLNRASMAEAQPLRDLRRLGLSVINRVSPVRNLAIRAGLGK